MERKCSIFTVTIFRSRCKYGVNGPRRRLAIGALVSHTKPARALAKRRPPLQLQFQFHLCLHFFPSPQSQRLIRPSVPPVILRILPALTPALVFPVACFRPQNKVCALGCCVSLHCRNSARSFLPLPSFLPSLPSSRHSPPPPPQSPLIPSLPCALHPRTCDPHLSINGRPLLHLVLLLECSFSAWIPEWSHIPPIL